jgi:hypothetical protein
MGASRLVPAVLSLALVAAGCGSGEGKFTSVPQSKTTATSSSPSVTATDPGNDSLLAGLQPREQKALASLVQAQAALTVRGDAVATAGTNLDKVVGRIAAGYSAPSGPSTPEVRRLADALTAFGSTLAPIASQPELLPQLSAELARRYEGLAKRRPAVAARLLDAKQQVDAIVEALPGLQSDVEAAASKAKSQASETTLNAEALDEAIKSGSQSTTTALNGVNQAVETGLAALQR